LRDGKNAPATQKTESRSGGPARRPTNEPAPKKTSEPAAAATTEPATGTDRDPAAVWQQVCAKVPARGFLRTLVDSLTVIGTEGRAFTLGYPPDEKSAIETLATTSNRRQLENLLREISGRDWTVKLEAREGLPARKTKQSSSPRAQEFKDDPLIQEALEMFKGEIRS
jgi:hypothetical protein